MSKKKKLILGTIAIALVLCCGASAISSILPSETTEMPTIASTAAIPTVNTAAQTTRTAADAAAWATKAAVPTTIPTIAPTSTAAPTIAPTAEPVVDVSELAYFAAMTEVMTLYTDATAALGMLAMETTDDPYVVFDDEWKIACAIYLSDILTAGEQLRRIEPPIKYSEPHAELLVAATHYDRFVDLYSRGIGEVDADLIAAAADEMQRGADAITRAGVMLLEMQ